MGDIQREPLSVLPSIPYQGSLNPKSISVARRGKLGAHFVAAVFTAFLLQHGIEVGRDHSVFLWRQKSWGLTLAGYGVISGSSLGSSLLPAWKGGAFSALCVSEGDREREADEPVVS